MSPGHPFSIRSKGQRSQGHKVQKRISGDRREFALYRVPASIVIYFQTMTLAYNAHREIISRGMQ